MSKVSRRNNIRTEINEIKNKITINCTKLNTVFEKINKMYYIRQCIWKCLVNCKHFI